MTDELDKLRRALDAGTPAPDAERRAATLRAAMVEFDRHQGSDALARPTSRRTRWVRVSEGVRRMFDAVTTKGGLAATTAVAALAMVWVVQDAGVFAPRMPDRSPAEHDAQVEQLVDNARRGDSDAAVTAPAAPRDLAFDAPMAESETFSERSAVASDTVESLAPQQNRSVSAKERGVQAPDAVIRTDPDTEAFANADPNPLKVTAEEPVSTFSADVDTASWSVIRSSLTRGALPPAEAVRIEEMVNYFPYDYPAPDGEHPFRADVTVGETPWNADTRLVRIGLQGAMPSVEDRPPLNLVFLIDTSGSMNDPAKLPLLVQSFRLMLGELRPEDQVAIVTYAGSAGLVLPPTPASEERTILNALGALDAGGSTAGQAGLEQAYATAEAMAADGEVSRVILATDGDFNVGLSDPSALKDYIAEKRASGTYLSVLGFGRGNLDDATMQALAQNGNGQAAYIDTLSEARKVLVDQLTGALFPIADDVKIQVEWNPAAVAEYRLIGYETRALAREDFNNDRVDAGEIGAGLSVTALYEVTPVGSPAVLNDPLRYQSDVPATGSDELGFLRLRYKAPGEDTSTLIETPILPGDGALSGDAAFAAAIAGFGQLLGDDRYLNGWSYGDAIDLANSARGADPFGYRTEAVTLMRLAESLDR